MREAGLVRAFRLLVVSALVWCVAVAGGCVVVEEGGGGSSGVRENDRGVSFGAPVASPALGAEVVNSRVVVGVRRLGSVPFSGQVLPVVSPGGRYVATQVGEPMDWETVLAGGGQSVAVGARVEVWALRRDGVEEIELAEPVPAGSVLGRSADSSGFLIERVLADGSRVVERVNWLTGRRVRVSGGGAGVVSGQATLLPRGAGEEGVGGAVWSSRGVEEVGSGLSSPAGAVRREAGAALRMPTAGAWPGEVHVVRQSAGSGGSGGGSVLLGLRLEGDGERARSSVAGRLRISDRWDAVTAYQALGSLQTPIVLAGGGEGVDLRPPGFMFFHPGRGRMVLMDRFTGGVVDLEDGSSAGAWHAAVGEGGGVSWGVFVTTPEGLRYQAVRGGGGGGGSGETLRALRGAVVLNESYVPRSTNDAAWPWVLIGPNADDPLRVDVLRMRLVDDSSM